MAGTVRAIAVDLDGTIAQHDQVSDVALAALKEARAGGTAALLVTGRTLAGLDAQFAGLRAWFDVVVAENGAVLQRGNDIRDLADPLGPVLSRHLTAAGIRHAVGRVIVACSAEDDHRVQAVLAEKGLDPHLVRNRTELMIIPAGISKGTGFLAALHELGLSQHNTIAFGDAENDLSLLHTAEIGVAVANALPSVKAFADLVADEPDGAGVAAVLRGPVVHGLRTLDLARHHIRIGEFVEGGEATIPGAQANVLIRGESGSGKSYLAGLLVERWIAAGYRAVVIDMEGDYVGLGQLTDVVVLSGRTSPPSRELSALLRRAGASVVLDLSDVPSEAVDPYLRDLATLVREERAAWGMPHWLLIDEAHDLLGSDGPLAEVVRASDLGHCIVTYRPEALDRSIYAAIDLTLTPCRESSLSAPSEGPCAMLAGPGVDPRRIRLDHRRTRHVRHWHKYTAKVLPEDHWFAFRTISGDVVAAARNVAEFVTLLRAVDPNVVALHLSRGDLSQWLLGSLGDRALASVVAAAEQDLLAAHTVAIDRARNTVIDAIERFYWFDGDRAV